MNQKSNRKTGEILCKRCGNPLAEDDRGRYYAQVCRDCCEKHGLCADCGSPVILTPEHAKNFACTGYHCTTFVIPITEPHTGDVETLKVAFGHEYDGEKICCPRCGGEHFVLRRVTLSDRMLASARLDAICIGCNYRESLYKIGENE